jgi:hypothetical protein
MTPENKVKTRDWMLTETVRLIEERSGRRHDDQSATALARAVPGNFADRLVARAAALPMAADIRADIERVTGLIRKLALGILLLATVAGLLAARASIAQREVDFLLAAATLLALPSLMLVVWAGLMLRGHRSGGSGSLAGHMLRRALAWISPRVLSGQHAGEVSLAGSRALATPFGRWLLSALAHAFWTVYLLAAICALTFFFLVAQYDLTWGTTLLTDEQIVSLVRLLAAPPAWLGLVPEPAAEWILGGREGALAPEARALWARFLIALVLVYGVLPRLLLLLGCSLLAWLRSTSLPLDTSLPGYLRLGGPLRPGERTITEHGSVPEATVPRRRRVPSNASGKPVLIGLELVGSNWPLTIPGIETNTLGRADDRAGRRAILAALDALPTVPPMLLVTCSLLRTPDASHQRFIDQAADHAGTIPVLLLVDGQRLTDRGDRLASRLADWQSLAERVGGQALQFDAEAIDAATLARLQRMMKGRFE